MNLTNSLSNSLKPNDIEILVEFVSLKRQINLSIPENGTLYDLKGAVTSYLEKDSS